ncbi:hypothetical protein TREES_T100002647 [Tupaia chinensis]|uniref:Uncharacterized protein n=1 Tax=Tupaia chinensis TaxID=246437 RepID=L9L714_TUPCH|nr:hypothetical protein TREES_T100002647 [Tupaia chinensis]
MCLSPVVTRSPGGGPAGPCPDCAASVRHLGRVVLWGLPCVLRGLQHAWASTEQTCCAAAEALLHPRVMLADRVHIPRLSLDSGHLEPSRSRRGPAVNHRPRGAPESFLLCELQLVQGVRHYRYDAEFPHFFLTVVEHCSLSATDMRGFRRAEVSLKPIISDLLEAAASLCVLWVGKLPCPALPCPAL